MSSDSPNPQYCQVAKQLFKVLQSGSFSVQSEALSLLGICIAYDKLNKHHSDSTSYDAKEISLSLDEENIVSLADLHWANLSQQMIDNVFALLDTIKDLDHALLFEHALSLYDRHHGKFYTTASQPIELTRLASHFLPKECKTEVYNPCAGAGSYQVNNPMLRFHSQEQNQQTWIIGKIRYLLNGITSNFALTHSLYNWMGDHQTFDAIIFTPPFALGIPQSDSANGQIPSSLFHHREMASWMLEHSIRSLNEGGVAISVVTLSFFFHLHLQKFREFLVDHGYLKSIILLPSHLFSFTSIPTALLVLEKKENQCTTFIDASSCYTKSQHCNILDWQKIVTLCEESPGPLKRIIPHQDIRERDYDITPAKYFLEEIIIPEGFHLVKVKDIATVISKKSTNHSEPEGRIIQMSDLARDPFHCIVDIQKLPLQKLDGPYTRIAKTVILLTRFPKLRPTIIHATEKDPAYIGRNIFALDVHAAYIYLPFLVYELSQRSERLEKGTMIPSFSMQDITNASIAIPSLDNNDDILAQQKASYKSLQLADGQAKLKAYGLEEIIHKQKQDFLDDLRIKNHTLTQYLLDINSDLLTLKKHISRQGYENEMMMTDSSLGDCVKSIIDNASLLGQNLSLLTAEKEFKTPEKFDLLDFLKDIKSADNYDVHCHIDRASIENEALIRISKTDFANIVSSITTNAKRHGFIENNIRYQMHIRVSYDQDTNMFAVEFSNNGKPMPQGMDTKRYGLKGEKAGSTANSGIGGYQVRSAVENAGGSYEVINDPASIFPVTILIKLPQYDNDEI